MHQLKNKNRSVETASVEEPRLTFNDVRDETELGKKLVEVIENFSSRNDTTSADDLEVIQKIRMRNAHRNRKINRLRS